MAEFLHQGGGTHGEAVDRNFGALHLKYLNRRIVRKHLGDGVHHPQRVHPCGQQFTQGIEAIGRLHEGITLADHGRDAALELVHFGTRLHAAHPQLGRRCHGDGNAQANRQACQGDAHPAQPTLMQLTQGFAEAVDHHGNRRIFADHDPDFGLLPGPQHACMRLQRLLDLLA